MRKLLGFVLSLAPVVALAAASAGNNCVGLLASTDKTLYRFMCQLGGILNAVLPLMIALAGVYLVWGVVSYIIADEEEAKKKGRSKIVYGIIGLAIIISLWGLVNLVVNTFGLDERENILPPTVVF